MEFIKVYELDLPERIFGFTVYQLDDDGQIYYTIILNAHLNCERRSQTYSHEMSHIQSKDFESMYDVGILESLRHAESI